MNDLIHELQTGRLTIRRVQASDWRGIREIYADASKSYYAQFDRPNDLDEDVVKARIARWADFSESAVHMFFAVCLGETIIGCIAFNARPDGYETGYCFHSAYHRKGYAKESFQALISALRERGVRKLEAGTAMDNTPSVSLLTSLGFTLTGNEQVSFYKDEHGKDIFFTGGIFELIL